MTISQAINELLTASKIKGSVTHTEIGLRGTKYFIKLSLGEKVSKIRSLQDELALVTHSLTIPDVYLESQVGLVVVDTTTVSNPQPIFLENLLSQVNLQDYTLPLVLGKDMSFRNVVLDLKDSPHILIGGTTGSGKSVLLQDMIYSLITKYSSDQLKLVLFDPKGTELNQLQSSQTLFYGSSFDDILNMIKTIEFLMEERYKHNSLDPQTKGDFPYIVVVIDELADLIMQDNKKIFKSSLIRILQKCRAAKIHIVAATQRPSRNIIDGLIRANMPTQIALKTSSSLDSRIIIDVPGAEKLSGNGDMLISHAGKILRVQGALTEKTLTFEQTA